MNKILIKNNSKHLNCLSFWSNFTFFNKNIKFDNNTFFRYEFDNNLESLTEEILSTEKLGCIIEDVNNELIKYKNEYYLVKNNDLTTYKIYIGNDYNNFNSFIIKKKNNNKYDLILSIQTSIFILFMCCRKTKSSNKLWKNNSNLLIKNAHFKYQNDYYRIGKIEEYNIKLSPINQCNRLIKETSFQTIKLNQSSFDTSYLDLFTIIFDIETMAVDKQHYPYMIYARTTSINWPIIKTLDKISTINLMNRDEVINALQLNDDNVDLTTFENDTFYGAEHIYENLTNSTLVHDFIQWIYRLIQKNLDYYQNNYCCRLMGFNNHRFDNNFILNELRKLPKFQIKFNQRFNKVTNITGQLQIGKFTVTLYIDDLIKFLPETNLLKACKDYNIKHSKIEFDIVKYNNKCTSNKHIYIYANNIHDYISDETIPNEGNIFEIIKKYCIADVESTNELYLKISGLILKLYLTLARFNINLKYLNFYRYISIPQMAFNIFKDIVRNENSINQNKFLLGKTPDVLQNEFIITSCIGGRVNFGILGEYISNQIKYMDVTSEYPLSMTAPFPSFDKPPVINPDVEPLNIIIRNITLNRNRAFNNKSYETMEYFKELFFGIFRVDIYPPSNPKDLIAWAPLPIKINGRNYFKNCAQFGRVINSIHIRTLIYCGWNVIIKQDDNNILFTSTHKIFKPFINVMGAMKTYYTPINKSFAKLCKLIMNSVAGKLAQKPTSILYSHLAECEFNDFIIKENITSKVTDYSTSLHYLSSYVTGYANWILYSTAYKLNLYSTYNNINSRAGILLYTDTDSIIFDASKTTYNKFTISEELGYWDDDLCDFKITWKEEHPNEIKKLIVIARKSYALFDSNNNTVDIKLKGIHNKQTKYFTWEILKQICSPEYLKDTIYFDGLKQEHFTEIKDIYKKISETQLSKTLALEKNYTKVEKPQHINNSNKSNLNLEFLPDKGYSNFLVFTQADGD